MSSNSSVPAWSQDAEFLKRACHIGDVAQSVAHGDEIEAWRPPSATVRRFPGSTGSGHEPILRKHTLAGVQADPHVNVVRRDAERRPGDQPGADRDIKKPHASVQAIPLGARRRCYPKPRCQSD